MIPADSRPESGKLQNHVTWTLTGPKILSNSLLSFIAGDGGVLTRWSKEAKVLLP